ncbi:MAG: YqaA family protein [Candidatus Aenigmatarchaeota archaeon]
MSVLNSLANWFIEVSNYSVETFGYLGIFFIGFLSSFTLFLPTPAFVVIFGLGAVMNPFLVGIFSGLGSAAGELTGFVVGYGSKQTITRKYEKQLKDLEKKFQKYSGWLVIFLFSVAPVPFDIIGIFCGNIGYPFKKFMIATTAGKLVKYLFIAYAGFYGIAWASSVFGLVL